MPYILHLETATRVCSVGLSLAGRLKQIEETEEEGFSHGENLTRLIALVLKNEGITSQDLVAVCVSSGPGSYTGLRIGVSVAKGLCYACSIPLLAIDSLHGLQVQARVSYPNSVIIPMIDARRMEVYCQVYGTTGETLSTIEAKVIDAESFQNFDHEQIVCCGDGAQKLTEIWSENSVRIDTQIKASASSQAALAYQKYQRSEFEEVAYFEPFYLKDFLVQKKKIPADK